MTTQDFLELLENGPFTWPGGYPMFFICADGGVISFDAAEERKAEILEAIKEPRSNQQWEVIASDVNWEDADLYCDHTNERIISAYAETE